MECITKHYAAFAGILVWLILTRTAAAGSCLDVQLPPVLLSGIPFHMSVTLAPFLSKDHVIPVSVLVSVYSNTTGIIQKIAITTRDNSGHTELNFDLKNITVKGLGYHTLFIELSKDSTRDSLDSFADFQQLVFVIPGWVTLLPPIITTVIAIILRQVLLALLIGIWSAAFFGSKCNPITALLRTLDTHIAGAMMNPSNAGIIAAVLFIGGLIGVVQKSGGAFGLAKVVKRFASSHRKACLISFGMCLCIFFDDFTLVLVVGYCMRKLMQDVGVSSDKLAFIAQSVATPLSCTVPISGAIGGQLGYILSGFRNPSCGKTEVKPFIILLKTLPYRFFAGLMIVCVFVVCLIGRDFGPMLRSERRAHNKSSASSAVSSSQDSLKGPLAPKVGVPHRWFNGVIPFMVLVVTCVVGLLLSGYFNFENSISQHMSNQVNITFELLLSSAHAISVIIWSSSLATLVLLVMLLGQCILSLSEFMEGWVEGVRNMVEPILILSLSFAFGNVIKEIQTSNFIAEAIKDGLPPVYIPAITALVAYFTAYAIGAAFGVMGILFPLIIPTVCELTPGEDNNNTLRIQTAAAILSSCLIGTVISPMAPHTILSKASIQCDTTSHLKTASVYVALVGIIAVLFGALPVGAGWYHWYVAWIIMVAVLVSVFVLFSSGQPPTSQPLLKRLCPCFYAACARICRKLAFSQMNCLRIRKKRKHRECINLFS